MVPRAHASQRGGQPRRLAPRVLLEPCALLLQEAPSPRGCLATPTALVPFAPMPSSMLGVGDRIPDATVFVAPREPVPLRRVVEDRPALLVFYLFDFSAT